VGATGIDGGIDGGNAAGGGPPPPPPLAPLSIFEALVAAGDRDVQAFLGSIPLTYQPSVGSPVTLTGVFDEDYVQAGSEPGVEAAGPAVFLILEDLPTDPMIDHPTLTIRGTDYRVIERHPDGLGGILLVLRTVV
jgi:hypothetical protein